MEQHSFIVTNIAYGTGPFLRITELAIAFNNELERLGKNRMPFIVPWIYGEKQKAIMLEDFGEHEKKYPGEILLDPKLGEILKRVFYTGSKRYEDTLRAWVETAEDVSRDAHEHLSGSFVVETLRGEKRTIDGKKIVLELNRSPRIRYDVAPSYSTTFGYIAAILEQVLLVPREEIDVDPELVRKGIVLADSIEGKQTLNTMAYPATFSWSEYKPRYDGEVLVPPITDLPRVDTRAMDRGIYVTITGIEGLERLYSEARELGLKLYSNDTKAVVGAEKALPSIIPNPAIAFQFARAGWGSLWLSMFSGTPIVVPKFDSTDDPEIYFNNRALVGLGFGIVYDRQSLSDILAEVPELRKRSAELVSDIEQRFGTRNGNEVCAKLFVDRFIVA